MNTDKHNLEKAISRIENVSRLLIVCDQSGVITYFNEKSRNIFSSINLNESIEALIPFDKNEVYPNLNFLQLAQKMREQSQVNRVVNVEYGKSKIEWLKVEFSFSEHPHDEIILEMQDSSDLQRIKRTQEYKMTLFENILNYTKEAVIAFDDMGRFEFFSPAAERIFGYTAAELLMDDITVLFSESAAETIEESLSKISKDPDPAAVNIRDYECVTSDGDKFPASTIWSKSNNKNFPLFFVNITDISLLKNFMTSIHDAYIRTDDHGILQDINSQAELLFGFSSDEMIGANIKQFNIKPKSENDEQDAEVEVISSPNLLLNKHMKTSKQEEFSAVTKDGSDIVVQVTLWPQASESGKLYNIIVRDITDKKLNEQKLFTSAFTDSLTKVANRAFFTKSLIAKIRDYSGPQDNFALLIIDLDHFKAVNDTYGHDHGDDLLVHAVDRLNSCIRSDDLLSRMGGDEFTIIIDKLSGIELVQKICQRIVDSFQKEFRIKGKSFVTTVSMGVAIYPNEGDSASDEEAANHLIKLADLAMYEAKRLGKNQYKEYSNDLQLRQVRHMQIQNNLNNAILNGEFYLHYQPKLYAPDMSIYGVEALLRWKSEELGQVHPGEFILIAEETGAIKKITKWVIEESVKQLCSWHDESALAEQYLSSVSINVSAGHLTDELITILANMIGKYDVVPSAIEIEITESAMMKNLDSCGIILDTIREMGINISIDDFGTGYSSMKYLQKLSFDAVKIDRSFIDRITENAHNRFIVEAIISIANGLGINVIAEGVERREDLDLLIQLGCVGFQGFYFLRPVAPEKILKFMLNNIEHNQKSA